MFKEIIGISTWCDYLTPCPNGKDCMVGDFDCSQCKHFNGIKRIEHNCSINVSPIDESYYNKYLMLTKTIVKCRLSTV